MSRACPHQTVKTIYEWRQVRRRRFRGETYTEEISLEVIGEWTTSGSLEGSSKLQGVVGEEGLW